MAHFILLFNNIKIVWLKSILNLKLVEIVWIKPSTLNPWNQHSVFSFSFIFLLSFEFNTHIGGGAVECSKSSSLRSHTSYVQIRKKVQADCIILACFLWKWDQRFIFPTFIYSTPLNKGMNNVVKEKKSYSYTFLLVFSWIEQALRASLDSQDC